MDGQIVTLEIPEAVVKQYQGKDDFKNFHDGFLIRHPPVKSYKSMNKGGNKDAKLPPVPLPRKRPLEVDLSANLVDVASVLATEGDEVLAEVPIINARSGQKLVSTPVLRITRKTGPVIVNQSGHEANWIPLQQYFFHVRIVSIYPISLWKSCGKQKIHQKIQNLDYDCEDMLKKITKHPWSHPAKVTLQRSAVLCGFGKAKFKEGAKDPNQLDLDLDIPFDVTPGSYVILDNQFGLLEEHLTRASQTKPNNCKVCYYTESKNPDGEWVLTKESVLK